MCTACLPASVPTCSLACSGAFVWQAHSHVRRWLAACHLQNSNHNMQLPYNNQALLVVRHRFPTPSVALGSGAFCSLGTAALLQVTEETEAMRFNIGIAAMMEFVNGAYKWDTRPRAVLAPFVLLLAPYAPHLGEEMWQVGHLPLHGQGNPEYSQCLPPNCRSSSGILHSEVLEVGLRSADPTGHCRAALQVEQWPAAHLACHTAGWYELVQQSYQLADPHSTITALQMLGNPGSLAYEPWPQYDGSRLVEDSFRLPVQVRRHLLHLPLPTSMHLLLPRSTGSVLQVNGKMRGTVQVPADINQQEAVQAACAVPGIAKFTDGKPTKKIIFVPNRILNIIVGK